MLLTSLNRMRRKGKKAVSQQAQDKDRETAISAHTLGGAAESNTKVRTQTYLLRAKHPIITKPSDSMFAHCSQLLLLYPRCSLRSIPSHLSFVAQSFEDL